MKTNSPICVIDDDAGVRGAVESLLRSEGFEVELFASAKNFLARAALGPVGGLILDLELPEKSGLDLQRDLAAAGHQIPIIFLTGRGTIPLSVQAMKGGAVEFLTKPLDGDELLAAVQAALSAGPSEELETKGGIEGVGGSRAFREVLQQIRLVAPTDSTVLILGETGTGKEIAAREIHRCSLRSGRPLIRVNCASIPKDLYESEFFGHVRGAFTGAFRDRVGRIEAADQGTLFLDEIGEIPLDLQCKLLRALQERQFERLGDEKTRSADVRIIAATNRDLEAEVAGGRFRQDLYYRLNVFPIEIAPLRERVEDIPLLAAHFIDLVTREAKCPRPRLTEAAIATLCNYDWPGNIRELRNVIEKAVIVARGGPLTFRLPHPSRAELAEPPREAGGNAAEFLTEPEMLRRERDNLLVVLEKTDWRIKGPGGAADLLGVKPTTLQSRIKKMGLRRMDATLL